MLAIVIPYYKLTFLEATLESLANQTDKRFKVYIGDDASPENPLDLLEKYRGQFDFIYHQFEENLGGISLVKQWERCIALSADEQWIMILGDDDMLGCNVIEAFYMNLKEIKLVSKVLRFATCKIDEKGVETSSVYLHPKIEKSTEYFFRHFRSSLSEYIFNKEQLKDIGFKDFPLGWYSDVLAVLEFSDFRELYTINEALVYIRISDLSISGSQWDLVLKSKSTFKFYYYLLSKKRDQFTRTEMQVLLKKINNCYLNNKIKVNWFFRISTIYFINFFLIEYCYFIKDILSSSLKKHFRNENRD
jgi:glycosyltransferase involved in cell wall biosynthesis